MDSQGPIILEKSIKIEEVIKIANTSIIDIVTKTVTPEIKAPYELVDVEYDKMGSDYILSILVDKEGGITVEDTSDLTNIISPLLDTIDPDPFPNQYMLEVSSPGLSVRLRQLTV